MSARKRANPSNNNAFEMLMSPKIPKSSKKSSRFVDCPVGCGAHVPEHQINQHLDACLGGGSSKTSDKTVKEAVSAGISAPKPVTVGQYIEKTIDAAFVSQRKKSVADLQSKTDARIICKQSCCCNDTSISITRNKCICTHDETISASLFSKGTTASAISLTLGR